MTGLLVGSELQSQAVASDCSALPPSTLWIEKWHRAEQQAQK